MLLLASFIYYGFYGWKYVIFLLLSIGMTYTGGRLGWSRCRQKANGKRIYLVTAALNLGLLLFFKYTPFLMGNLNQIFRVLFNIEIAVPKLLLPVGLSFFVFQSSSYLFDLFHSKIEPEKNVITYGAFVSFFPTLISGPIQKSRQLLPKFRENRTLSYDRFVQSVFIFLYGAFLKLVLADRLALFTNPIFESYQTYDGCLLFLAMLAYTVQIYTDFAGYSYMAIAVAGLFGFDLEENFKRPYLAVSVADFWRRWHISLTGWFREYLYYPLGGNRKGKLKSYCNIAIIFIVSGLWHGAAWSFIVWGALHAGFQIVGRLTLKTRERLCTRLNIERESMGYRLWQRSFVFLLAAFAWVFFRSASLQDAIMFFLHIIRNWHVWALVDGTLFTVGLSALEMSICLWGILILIFVSNFQEQGKQVEWLLQQNRLIKWGCCLFLIVVIFIFGMYGPGYSGASFIYAGF